MFNFCNFLLAGNYVILVAVGVAVLVLLVAVMAFVVFSVRKKNKSANKADSVSENKVQTENTVESQEEPHTPEASAQAQNDNSAVVNAETVETAERAEESASVTQTAVAEVTIADDNEDEDVDDEETVEDIANEEEYDVAPQRSVARINGAVRYIIIKYNKSFKAKLIQSGEEVKNYYSALKNELLSYNGVKTRISWKGESFYCGRKTYAKLCIRGKSVCLFLALNANDYVETKYKVDDMSEVAAYEKIPCLYRIKNERRLKYAADLIATAMDGREKLEDYTETDFAKQYPYEDIEPLIERKLVKVLTEEDAKSGDVFKPRDMVTVSEANELLQDEIAVALIEETDETSDKTKFDIINIDTLSKNFADGETVTLEEIKKRISSFSKKAPAVKVLARGKLDKKLTVIADSYSIEAAKMILLTGGNAVKKKNS